MSQDGDFLHHLDVNLPQDTHFVNLINKEGTVRFFVVDHDLILIGAINADESNRI